MAGNGGSNGSAARFEYRAWGEALTALEGQIVRVGRSSGTRDSRETYIVSPADPSINSKIRDELLDVKVLVRVHAGFQQWEPRLKCGFPLTDAAVRRSFFPLLGLDHPALDRIEYTPQQLVDEVISICPGLVVVEVGKHRRDFVLEGCLAEITAVALPDRSLQTVAIEGEDAAEVVAVGSQIGIDVYENVSYPEEICRLSSVGGLHRSET